MTFCDVTCRAADVAAEEVCVRIGQPEDYNAVLEVNDSDHKPVYALLQVELPGYQQVRRRGWEG